MKKAIVLLVGVVVSLSLFGCFGNSNSAENNSAQNDSAATAPAAVASEPSAFELWMTAAEDMDKAESVSYDMDFEMSLSLGETPTVTKMSGTAVMINHKDPANFQMFQDMTTSGLPGAEDMNILIYYKDGFMYSEALGQKIKQKLDTAEALSLADDPSLDFPESAVKDQKVVDLSDGSKDISLTIDGTAMTDYARKKLGDDFDASIQVSLDDVLVIGHVDKNGNMTTMNMEINMTLSSGGSSIESSIAMTMTNIKLNSSTITFPDDMDSYQEVAA